MGPRAAALAAVVVAAARGAHALCGASFVMAPGSESAAESTLHLLRYGPPLGNVSAADGTATITLSIPTGETGMGGQQFWAYAKAGGDCGMPGDRAEADGYTLFPVNCSTSGTCIGTVPSSISSSLTCPPPSTAPTVFAVLGAPGSRTAAVMYCATWGANVTRQDPIVTRYLQQQAAMLYSLQMQVASNTGGGQSGLLFTHKADENAAIASIALVVAVLHALLGVYVWFARRQARNSLRTRQYLQLDSLAPDEYDVQRLEGEPGDF